MLKQLAKRSTGQFKSGVFVGELAETLHMIRNPAAALRRGVDDYLSDVKKRFGRVDRSKRLKIASESWLEYSFGWAPLFSDIKSGARALAEYNLHRRPKETIIVSSVESESDTLSSDLIIGALGTHALCTRTTSCQIRFKAKLAMDEFSDGKDLRTSLGVTPSEVLPTAWELIPWSFLIDYFTNIGDLISAYSQPTISLAWCEKGEMISQRCDTLHSPIQDWLGSVAWADSYTFSPSRVEIERIIKDRASYTGGFLPSFRLKVPGFDSLKWLNIGALFEAKRSFQRFL